MAKGAVWPQRACTFAFGPSRTYISLNLGVSSKSPRLDLKSASSPLQIPTKGLTSLILLYNPCEHFCLRPFLAYQHTLFFSPLQLYSFPPHSLQRCVPTLSSSSSPRPPLRWPPRAVTRARAKAATSALQWSPRLTTRKSPRRSPRQSPRSPSLRKTTSSSTW